MIRRYRYATVAIIAVAMIVMLGCSFSSFGLRRAQVGPLRTESASTQLQGAEQVRVSLRMGAGELNVKSGADALMDAEFTYNVQAWKPEVTYSVANGEGNLNVQQSNTDEITIGEGIRNTWDISLSNQVPLDVHIECGAGNHDVDLSGLQVTGLDMKLGAGSATVDVSDNPELSRLSFDIGAGDAEIDLSGPANQNVEADIQGGVGSTTLHLPGDVGVRVNVTRGIGDIETSGLFSQGNNTWVNDVYGKTDVTVNVDITSGIGRIALDVQQ